MIKRLQVIALSLRVNLSLQPLLCRVFPMLFVLPLYDLFHQFSCSPSLTRSPAATLLQESLLLSSVLVERVLNVICISTKDSEGCNIPHWHTFTALPGVRRRRSDDTCDLVDAVVAKQPSQNSMPAIHYSNSSDSNSLLLSCVQHTQRLAHTLWASSFVVFLYVRPKLKLTEFN